MTFCQLCIGFEGMNARSSDLRKESISGEIVNFVTSSERLAALEQYSNLEAAIEPAFDDIVLLASQICATPTSLVSFVGKDRQWFEAKLGFSFCSTPLSHSVCQHGLSQTELLIIPDLAVDERTQHIAAANDESALRFYAGAPLSTTDGHVLGMLCVMDTKARSGLTPTQQVMLRALARQVMVLLEARRTLRERDKAILEFRESEAKLKAVLEAVPVGIVLAEAPSGRIIQGNAQAEHIFGHALIPSPDIEGYRDWVAYHEDGKRVEGPEYPLARVLSGQEERPELEVRYRRGEGCEAWIRLIAAPIRNEFGKVMGGVVASLDIDREKRAEASLRRMNEELEIEVARRTEERDQLWRMPNLLISIKDFEGTILAVNPGWQATLGWTKLELVGHPYTKFIHSDDAQQSIEWFTKLRAGETIRELRNRYRRKDGSFCCIAWTVRQGAKVFQCVGRDVTVEEQQIRELARAEEQLRQAQKMEAVGQLTGGIAHDFNNLLTSIIGGLDMVSIRIAQGRTDNVDRFITIAQGASRRAATLIQRLLSFSRLQTLEPKPTDVRVLVSGMEDLIRRAVGPSVEIETFNATGLWTSLIDPNQLENAILNLCINARDAMPGGGKIMIETDNRWINSLAAAERQLKPGQYISLCVSDTGAGMTDEVMSKAFEPFFTTKPIGMGSGLGLSMIYGFAQQSGGTVSLHSKLGKGSTVCIYLPRHLGPPQSNEEPGDEFMQKPQSEQGLSVLVIDDEPTIRMLVKEVLSDLSCRVLEATDGLEGLRIINSDTRIDLLVTDIGLPGGMTGREVANRARLVRPGLKVLFITGYADVAMLNHDALDAETQILFKPFTVQAIAGRIKETIVD